MLALSVAMDYPIFHQVKPRVQKLKLRMLCVLLQETDQYDLMQDFQCKNTLQYHKRQNQSTKSQSKKFQASLVS